MRKLIYFILLIATRSVAAEGSFPCSQLKEYIDGVWAGKNDPSTSVEWVAGNYSYFNPYLDKTNTETYIHFSHFDIDNNGADDTIIKSVGGIGGGYGDTLTVILDQTIDLSGGFSHSNSPVYDFGENTLYRITSYPPWPYKNQGVLLAQMVPFFFNGKTYLILIDSKKQGFFIADYSKSTESEIKHNIHSVLLKPECGRNM